MRVGGHLAALMQVDMVFGSVFPSILRPAFDAGGGFFAPSNLNGTLAFGPQITLTWTDNANNESGFVIQRATNGVNFTQIGTVAANVTTYLDTTGAANTTYTYRVAATNFFGTSAWSNTFQQVVPAAPNAPTTLALLPQYFGFIRVVWRDNATNETGFSIERSTNGGAFSQIGTRAAFAGTGPNIYWDDTTVQAGNTYTYRVAAVNAAVRSAYSNTASFAVPTVPGKPTITNVTTALNGTNENATVTWLDNATNEVQYIVYRSAAGGVNYYPLGTAVVAANTTQYTFTAIPRQVWYFRVVARNMTADTPSDIWGPVAAP